MTRENARSLQDLIDSVPDLINYFRNETLSPHVVNRAGISPVPLEFTNWRDEQRAWRESVLLLDLSHHMPETFINGPDAVSLLSSLGINSFENFEPLRAKQYLCCGHDGRVIGECLMEHHADGSFELISGMHVQNWVQYNAEVGKYDVELVRDHPTAQNPAGRKNFRFQLEGPSAELVLTDASETAIPDIAFFRLGYCKVAGCDVLLLRHGVAGHKGVELSGPTADGPKVRDALLAAGEKYGLKRGGHKALFSALGEVGWVGYPTPAIYSDPRLAEYRKWLPADSWEAQTQFGGSFRSANIEDYYVTPWDLGLQRLLKFDHDFIGREALQELAARDDHRKKVTLVWDKEDVLKLFASTLEPGTPYKYPDLPKSSYGWQHNDEIRNLSGDPVGVSVFTGYTVNESKFLSVAFVHPDYATPGTEVLHVWGEPDGRSHLPSVEKHRQTTIRATVAPTPYATSVRALKNADLVKRAP
jgi:vanillate/3-O-methylgallate O-demethylase